MINLVVRYISHVATPGNSADYALPVCHCNVLTYFARRRCRFPPVDYAPQCAFTGKHLLSRFLNSAA
eukprot:4914415-Pleurochrysis_carterae.AAC.1